MLLVPQKTPGISQSGPFLIIIQSVHLHFSHYGGASKHIMDDIQFVDTFNFLICYFFGKLSLNGIYAIIMIIIHLFSLIDFLEYRISKRI